MADNKLTAAEHFAEAERLLAKADKCYADEDVAGWAARAQAHIAAAEFLVNAHQITHTKAGLLDILSNRNAGGEQ